MIAHDGKSVNFNGKMLAQIIWEKNEILRFTRTRARSG
jgi:hypothetical protein